MGILAHMLVEKLHFWVVSILNEKAVAFLNALFTSCDPTYNKA